MISISRSGLESYQSCPRQYYYRYVDGGRGWASTIEKTTALQQGTILHSGMENLMRAILAGTEPAQAAYEGLAAIREGRYTLPDQRDFDIIEALYFAWVRTRLEEFLAEYEIVSVESPTELTLSKIKLYVRDDVLVRSRHSELLFSVDWKSTASGNYWGTRWRREPQGFLQTWASRQKHPDVVGTIFEGLVKGQKRDGDYTSPLTRCWMGLDGEGEQFFSMEKDKGLVKCNPATLQWPSGPGLEGWVSWLPYEVVRSSIVTSPPVVLPPDWELWLLESEKALLRDYEDGLWPRHYGDDTCRWCPFDPICGGDKTLNQMVEEGLLVSRPLSPREEAK
jgi:hypothetical protein